MTLALRKNLGRYDWQNLVPGTPAAVVFSAAFFGVTAAAAAIEASAEPGSVSITGQAAVAGRGLSGSANSGSIVITGQAATLLTQRSANAASGSVTIAGQAATLARTRISTAASAPVNITGQAAFGMLGISASAAPGTLSIGGTAASASWARSLLADPGASTAIGQAATLVVSRQASLDGTVVSIAGSDADILVLHSYTAPAYPTTVNVVWAEADLVYTPVLYTTGERLTSLSGLSPRSAFNHFMAITAGSGPGKTIFASQMTVCVEEAETVCVRQAERSSAASMGATNTGLRQGYKRTDVLLHPAEGRVFIPTCREHVVIVRGKKLVRQQHKKETTKIMLSQSKTQ